ncbi:MAG: (d)CMP kinase [Actinomycetes bacterium]
MTISPVVAIDGPAGSGKSTIAKMLADRLQWSFLDTGAMYRAVTALALREGIDPNNSSSVSSIASNARIETIPAVTINGLDVTIEIRQPEVNHAVSIVAANPDVRAAMVDRQREWSNRQPAGTVVEGRDIGTVVFPDALLKVFLTASPEERARRRGDETAASIQRRDEIDSSRDHSPLRVDEAAVIIDTTNKDVEAVIEEIVACLNLR